MQKQHSPVEEDNGMIEISLSDLIATIWRGRWIVVCVTVVVAAISLIVVLQTAVYKSEGFFQFGGAIPGKDLDLETDKKKNKEKDKEKDKELSPGISMADFKRFAASYTTGERFSEYIKDTKLDAAPGVADLRREFNSRGGISKSIEPVYIFTQLDAKRLMAPKESNNDVIGLQFNVEHSDPALAQQMVALLGRYTLDSIIYDVYSDTLYFKRNEIVTKATKLDNEIIRNSELLDEYLRKSAELKRIISQHPGAAEQRSQQVISVNDESVRYLSPVTQLVSTEVQIAETRENDLKIKRDQKQVKLRQEYYDEVKKLIDSTKSGEAILRGMESAKERVFKDKNIGDDVVKEVYNIFTIDNQNAINVYLENSRFVAGPTLPIRSSARPLLALAGGLFAGFFLSLIIVFSREWWRNSQTKTPH